jgi:hypothetical protein
LGLGSLGEHLIEIGIGECLLGAEPAQRRGIEEQGAARKVDVETDLGAGETGNAVGEHGDQQESEESGRDEDRAEPEQPEAALSRIAAADATAHLRTVPVRRRRIDPGGNVTHRLRDIS